MQYVKGKTSRKLLMKSRYLKKQQWGRRLWARGYFVAKSGNVSDEAVIEHFRQQERKVPEDGDDHFQVTKS